MKKIIFSFAVFSTLILSAFTVINSIEWKIQEGYSIEFSSDNPSGKFTRFKGRILFDEDNLPASKFEVEIETASINTGNGMKNNHAKSDKWFDAKKYPVVKFVSSNIGKVESEYIATGILDMHGVQKEISIPFKFQGNIFSGSFTINRLDYNIGTDKGMSAKASKEIRVNISVPVKK